jgi:diguanylate cyclase (GGDEF)-like protein
MPATAGAETVFIASPGLGSISDLAATAFATSSEVLDAVLSLAQELLGMGTVFIAETDRRAGRLSVVAVREGAAGCGIEPGLEIPFHETVWDRIVGSPDPLAIPDLQEHPDAEALSPVCELGARGYVSVPILHGDGSMFGMLCGLDLSPRDVSPEELCWLRILAGLVGFQLERERLEARLAYQASHDALTALANRAYFMERLERVERRAPRDSDIVALLFVDLDNFKSVNDQLGHAVGDRLLIAVADRLRACVRSDDLVARVGGDEMVILAENVESEAVAVALAERILESLAAPYDLGGVMVSAPPSIGVALSDPLRVDECLTGLLRSADLAMYRAKAAGKGTYALYDPSMVANLAG